jgi:hypothetical protein
LIHRSAGCGNGFGWAGSSLTGRGDAGVERASGPKSPPARWGATFRRARRPVPAKCLCIRSHRQVRQYHRPERVRDLGMRDVAVRARRATAVLYNLARLEIVDAAAQKVVRERRGLHCDILDAGEALDAERADPAVGRILLAEHELLLQLRAQGIEAANRGVALRACRDERPAYESLLQDTVEVACGARRIRDVAGVRPERERCEMTGIRVAHFKGNGLVA